MLFEFEITQEDFLESARFNEQIRRSKSNYRRIVEPICWFFVFAAWLANLYYFPKDFSTWAFPFMVVGGNFFIEAMIPIRLRRQYREEPSLWRRRMVEVDESGVRIVLTPWEVHRQWDAFAGFHEGAESFVLVDEEGKLLPLVPKRALASSQIAELRSLLEAHIARK